MCIGLIARARAHMHTHTHSHTFHLSSPEFIQTYHPSPNTSTHLAKQVGQVLVGEPRTIAWFRATAWSTEC